MSGSQVEVDVADRVIRDADELGQEDDWASVLAGNGGRPTVGGRIRAIPGQRLAVVPVPQCTQLALVYQLGHLAKAPPMELVVAAGLEHRPVREVANAAPPKSAASTPSTAPPRRTRQTT